MSLKRGDIYFAELNPVQGSEQGGMRPVLVVQNDVGNNYSPTTIVLPITSPAKAQTAHPRGPQPTGIRPDARLCGAGRANPHH